MHGECTAGAGAASDGAGGETLCASLGGGGGAVRCGVSVVR